MSYQLFSRFFVFPLPFSGTWLVLLSRCGSLHVPAGFLHVAPVLVLPNSPCPVSPISSGPPLVPLSFRAPTLSHSRPAARVLVLSNSPCPITCPVSPYSNGTHPVPLSCSAPPYLTLIQWLLSYSTPSPWPLSCPNLLQWPLTYPVSSSAPCPILLPFTALFPSFLLAFVPFHFLQWPLYYPIILQWPLFRPTPFSAPYSLSHSFSTLLS